MFNIPYNVNYPYSPYVNDKTRPENLLNRLLSHRCHVNHKDLKAVLEGYI